MDDNTRPCPKCGADLSASAKFCEQCGSASSTDAVATPPPFTCQAPTKGKKYTFLGKAKYADDAAAFVKDLLEREKMLTQTVTHGEDRIIQGRHDPARWQKFVKTALGMDAAATVCVTPSGDDLVLTVGAGKWMDKAVGVGVALLFFAPALITTGWGVYAQKKLFKSIAKRVEEFLLERP